jgi:hypothetical protein
VLNLVEHMLSSVAVMAVALAPAPVLAESKSLVAATNPFKQEETALLEFRVWRNEWHPWEIPSGRSIVDGVDVEF